MEGERRRGKCSVYGMSCRDAVVVVQCGDQRIIPGNPGTHLFAEFVFELLLSTGKSVYPSHGALIVALEVLDSFPQATISIPFLP